MRVARPSARDATVDGYGERASLRSVRLRPAPPRPVAVPRAGRSRCPPAQASLRVPIDRPSDSRLRPRIGRREWPLASPTSEPGLAIGGQLVTIIGTVRLCPRGVAFKVTSCWWKHEILSWTRAESRFACRRRSHPWHRLRDVPSTTVTSPRSGPTRDAEIWHTLQDGQWGAWRPVAWRRPRANFTPSGDDGHPQRVTPEVEKCLHRGANFGDESGSGRNAHRVLLTLGGQDIAHRVPGMARISTFSARVRHDITGLGRSRAACCRSSIAWGSRGRRAGLSFVPAEDVAEIETRKYVVICTRIASRSAGSATRRRSRCSSGELRNGWTVEDSCSRWTRPRHAGRFFERQPRKGDTTRRPDHRLGRWALPRRVHTAPTSVRAKGTSRSELRDPTGHGLAPTRHRRGRIQGRAKAEPVTPKLAPEIPAERSG